MATNDKLEEVLNDLIQINNDRITGYDKANHEAKDVDVDLQATFSKMADESRKYKAELTEAVRNLGGDPDTSETTNSGKIYRVWMDVKATFTGHSRQAILENCEFGEDAAQKAYKMALASDAEMNADTRQLITSQQASLKTSHDIIKKYRDAQKAAND
ncbi:MAG: PA2169 family four-helix-bundle protein [Ferruginibacter sp.]